MNKIISLLPGPQWSKSNPSEKKADKIGQKMCGNEVRLSMRTLIYLNVMKGLGVFIHCCLPFFSFNLATRGVKKMTYLILELMGVGPRPEHSTLSV